MPVTPRGAAPAGAACWRSLKSPRSTPLPGTVVISVIPEPREVLLKSINSLLTSIHSSQVQGRRLIELALLLPLNYLSHSATAKLSSSHSSRLIRRGVRGPSCLIPPSRYRTRRGTSRERRGRAAWQPPPLGCGRCRTRRRYLHMWTRACTGRCMWERARNGSVTGTEGQAEQRPAAPHVPACLPTLPTPHRAHTPTRLPAPGRALASRLQPDAAAVVRPERVVPWCFCLLSSGARLRAPRNGRHRWLPARQRAHCRRTRAAHAWLGSGCELELGCTFRSGRVLFDELATPVKSAAPMHTIDIVRMPAGRPAHPRSTPITEPRTAASSKLRHSCSSSAKMTPPRNRCNAWVRCGNLPVSLRRGGPVLENR